MQNVPEPAPRTVTVPTLDHGLIVMPEPAWCAGHDNEPTELRIDTGHRGVAHTMTYEGYELAYAALVQDPFIEPRRQAVGVLVEMGDLAHRLDSGELDALAAVLVQYAGTLRHLARLLSTLQAGEGR